MFLPCELCSQGKILRVFTVLIGGFAIGGII